MRLLPFPRPILCEEETVAWVAPMKLSALPLTACLPCLFAGRRNGLCRTRPQDTGVPRPSPACRQTSLQNGNWQTRWHLASTVCIRDDVMCERVMGRSKMCGPLDKSCWHSCRNTLVLRGYSKHFPSKGSESSPPFRAPNAAEV